MARPPYHLPRGRRDLSAPLSPPLRGHLRLAMCTQYVMCAPHYSQVSRTVVFPQATFRGSFGAPQGLHPTSSANLRATRCRGYRVSARSQGCSQRPPWFGSPPHPSKYPDEGQVVSRPPRQGVAPSMSTRVDAGAVALAPTPPTPIHSTPQRGAASSTARPSKGQPHSQRALAWGSHIHNALQCGEAVSKRAPPWGNLVQSTPQRGAATSTTRPSVEQPHPRRAPAWGSHVHSTTSVGPRPQHTPTLGSHVHSTPQRGAATSTTHPNVGQPRPQCFPTWGSHVHGTP